MNRKPYALPLWILCFTLVPNFFLPFLLASSLVVCSESQPSTQIEVILSPRSAPYEGRIKHETQNILRLYNQWFGPFSNNLPLTIADSASLSRILTPLPNLILINPQPVPFTRFLERTLAIEIARLWFSAQNITDPFLSFGLPAYAANRYLETTYGKDNLLDLPVSIPFLSGASDHYLHKVYYYIAAVNHLTIPLLEPKPFTVNFVNDAVYRSQAVLILKALEKKLGPTIIDSAIRMYRKKFILSDTLLVGEQPISPKTPGFIACLTAAAGPANEVIIYHIFQQNGTCDLKINRVYRQGEKIIINFSALPPLNLPVEVKTIFNDQTTRTDTVFLNAINRLTFVAEKKVSRVIIDPDTIILEPDRWNNFYPRQIKILPIFALPDFESYQIFYGPWFWYDNYRGFQPGIWFQGRKFIDAGPIRGEHNWTLNQNYASNKSDWHTGCSYQTPLLFYPLRLRLYFTGDNSFRDRGVKLYLTSEIGRPFQFPHDEIQLGYRLYELLDLTGRDPRAWDRARIAELRTRWYRQNKIPGFSTQHELIYYQGLKPALSEYAYTKISLLENLTVWPAKLPPVSIRIFIGAIYGSVPLQEKFYLSGGLTYTASEPISWAYEGIASSQEHWHYDGDANCRGYYGLYRSGRFAWGVNIHLHPPSSWRFPFSAIHPFLDLGNVTDSLSPTLLKPVCDAGVRLKFGPLYADFPLWKSSPQNGERPIAFRWSVGFKLSELPTGM